MCQRQRVRFVFCSGLSAVQVEVEQREAHAADLQQQVSAAESQMSSRVEELAVLGKQLQGLQQDLAKTTSQLAEREAKVGCACSSRVAFSICIQQNVL